ncbi:tyrosine-type recombinase/integrase [Arthrobacter sp. 18067]|uniref:tyrosine-type recombinase/integrase n=1 Tax=Arthrobacter sp. 18067 TaxID=2681413 RepID=UPI00135BBEAD|nr:tyrosine-type recombinase/integrase [Arthrobacter sp. 18067]
MTEFREIAVDDIDGGRIQRMRLALSPRFTADIIVFDDEAFAGRFFPLCSVPGCLRYRPGELFCNLHVQRWRARGKPPLEEFYKTTGKPPEPEAVDLSGLPSPLRWEVALALQLVASSPGERFRRLPAPEIRKYVALLQSRGVLSLIDGDNPLDLGDARREIHRVNNALFRMMSNFRDPSDPNDTYARNLWHLTSMGFVGKKGAGGTLQFAPITQPWLRELAKRFMRWRISSGTGYHQLNRDITALHRLSAAFTEHAGPTAGLELFSRETLEVHMNLLLRLNLGQASRRYELGSISMFLKATRQHDWEPRLPASVWIHPSDLPRLPVSAPRALPEYVMAQIESPEALSRLEQPHRLMMQILIGTGLRLADAYHLDIDCVVRDGQNAPYLRYRNHKMSREAFTPISEEMAGAITERAAEVLSSIPSAQCLAPAPTSRDGTRPLATAVASVRLASWQESIGLRDQHGRPFRFTAHQLRHTYGTRMINSDVPQEVVRRLLDHESNDMTARYARLNDATIRRHWEKATKINVQGEAINIEQAPGLSDAAWMKEHLGRATMALPNGYCGLPLQQSCPHANACLTCPVFVTTPDFLGEHLAQLRTTKRLIAEAKSTGRTRMVEMNTKVAGNLENIINTIRSSGTESQEPDGAS